MKTDYKKDAVFCKVIPLVVNIEGGYVNGPKDTGGPTMYGVSWNNNADWLKANCGMKRPTDIKNLTQEEAKWCYYERYWLKSGANGITDVDMGYMQLDAAVNCGVTKAQAFLGNLSRDPRHYDGTGGKNRTLFLTLFLEYTAQRLSFYTHCKERDTYLEGWSNRLVGVIQNSLGLD